MSQYRSIFYLVGKRFRLPQLIVGEIAVSAPQRKFGRYAEVGCYSVLVANLTQ